MPHIESHQTNFTSGELSPFLTARTDLNQYANGASTLQNFLVRGQGGLIKRSGTRYVAEVKDSSKNCRLLPFEYSTTDAYAIEIGAGYFRFYRNGGQLLSTAAVTNGTFATDLTGWTDGDTGTGVSSQTTGVMRLNGGAAGVAKRTQAITYVGTSQYTLTFTVASNDCVYTIGTTDGGTEIATGTGSVGANSVNFTPSVDGTIYIGFSNANNNNSDVDTVVLSTPVYQVKNSYAEADLDSIVYAQSFDVMYLVHGDYAPATLTRYGHSQWVLEDIAFEDGPYFDVTDRTYGGTGANFNMTPSGTTGSITMTAASSIFVSTDVGRYIRFRSVNTAAWGYGVITAYTSGTSVTVSVVTALDSASASKEWRLGAWSNTTGFPSCVCLFSQRLIFARSDAQQQTLWLSTAGDLYNFQPDNSARKDVVEAITAISYTLADTKASVIRWLGAQKTLYVGTSSGIWAVKGNVSPADTTDPFSIVPIINDGANQYAPVITRTAILYGQRFGRKLLEIGYQFAEDQFRATDLAILAEHRTKGNLKWMTSCMSPNYMIWSTTEDGILNTTTYIREQNVVAWAQQIIGGTDVNVKSIISLPSTYEDQLWLIVSRTINGSTKQYVEYLTQTFIEQAVTDACFVDSSLTYSGAATSTLTGLDHLEGESVKVFGNGAQVVATSVVTSGAITLAEEVTSAVVGLGYDSIFASNPLHAQYQGGIVQGHRARINKAQLRLYRSYGGQIGQDSTSLDVMPEYSSNTYMGNSLELETGMVEYFVKGSTKFLPTIYIKHSDPVPFSLLSIVYHANIG